MANLDTLFANYSGVFIAFLSFIVAVSAIRMVFRLFEGINEYRRRQERYIFKK